MPENTNRNKNKKRAFSPTYWLALMLLLSAVLFLNPALKALANHYEKRPAPLRRSICEFSPAVLPSFQNGWNVSFQEVSVEDVGTDEYVYCVLDRKIKDRIPCHADFFITFYNEPADKVPHTPDVCSRQAGAKVIHLKQIFITPKNLPTRFDKIPALLFIYQNPGDKEYVCDIFFFYTCGTFRRSRNEVRLTLANPFRKEVFFSKIEAAVRFSPDADPDPYIAFCKNLIVESLPILLNDFYPACESSRP